MARLFLYNENIPDPGAFLSLCPFNALEITDGIVSVNEACRLCKVCVNEGPAGAAMLVEDAEDDEDLSAWCGVSVYADRLGGKLHPVTFELLGKARELADQQGHSVFALCIGSDITVLCEELLYYGADAIYVYDDPALRYFHIESYTAVFRDFVNQVRPASILIGGTSAGRQLAPRLAARLRTGLTADCTVLEIGKDGNLVQIRPAFGGNIMAEIITANHRPQMATVRYKVLETPARGVRRIGEIIRCDIPALPAGRLEVLKAVPKEVEQAIESAEVLVVAGRGIKKREDLLLLQELADLLGGQLACTRPLAEAGWMDAKRQIGLSGRTVRPKLIITCGVSGAIQFVAGMNASELIVAVNSDENAPVMQVAHIAVVGDLYEIVPPLIRRLKDASGGYDYAI